MKLFVEEKMTIQTTGHFNQLKKTSEQCRNIVRLSAINSKVDIGKVQVTNNN